MVIMNELHISEAELSYLRLIDRGHLEHGFLKPQPVIHLISKGMIEEVTSMVFPLIAPRTIYRITPLGKQTLAAIGNPGP